MQDQIERHDSASCVGHSKPLSGTGFVYCPEPDARVRRAVRAACNDARYGGPLTMLVIFAVAGTLAVFGGAFLTMLGVRF
jgi:hypothetical protein